MRRRDLKPGQMFVAHQPARLDRFSDVLVVLDTKTEVGFFRGGVFCVGDVAPALRVEVIA